MHNLRRMFGQRVLPIVYDDSLSYYEMICKMIRTINEIIENNNLLEQYVGSYMPTFNGDWDVTKTYQPLSVVLYDDQLYIAKQEVPVGIAITAGDYWEEINLPYFDAIANLNTLDVLIPDQFTGTDTEKINAAFEAAETGGTICLNRKYTLDDNIVITHLTSRQKNFVHVLGIGKYAEIDLNGYSITGAAEPGEAYGSNSVGGIFWDNIEFSGKEDQNGFITDRLIRMFFTNCHFFGMNRAFYSNDSFVFNNVSKYGYAQSYHFSQCYFASMKTAAFDVYRLFDCHFVNCIFEYDSSVINVRHGAEGLYIVDCLMETMPNATAITVHGATGGTHTDGIYNLTISNCYFEDNLVSIDIQNLGNKAMAAIENCMCSINRANQLFIHMPRDIQSQYGNNNELHPALRITGNAILPTPTYDGTNALHFDLFREDGRTPWMYQLTGLYFEGNNFDLTNSNATMAQLYTLNYKPVNHAYTKRGQFNVQTLFNPDGSATISTPAPIPFDAVSNNYKVVSLKNTATGQDICVENNQSVEPSTWYYVSATQGSVKLAVRRVDGEPVVDRAVLAARAGGVICSMTLEWAYADVSEA